MKEGVQAALLPFATAGYCESAVTRLLYMQPSSSGISSGKGSVTMFPAALLTGLDVPGRITSTQKGEYCLMRLRM